MHSSKILKDEQVENVVFDFNPQKFPVVVPEQANDFMQAEGQRQDSGFKLNELISGQIGLAENEHKRIEEKLEALALEKLKEVQEKAYKEAYDVGLEEGRQHAYESVQLELREKLKSLEELIESISNLKKDLVVKNERSLVELVGFIANRLALQHIENDEEAIVNIITAAVEDSQDEERILVKVSEKDFQFLDENAEEMKKKISAMKKIKLEVGEEIKPGGCIVETNYGVVDASVEQRLEKLWDILKEKVPVVKEQAG